MRKACIAIGLLAAVASFVAPAQAGISGDDENDYEGTFDGIASSYFGFDLNSAKTKVKGITAYIGYFCENDDQVVGIAEADGSLKLDESRRFSGKVVYEDDTYRVEYRIEGKLKKEGKARGTFKGKYEDDTYETPCKTGELGWRAKKGAEVEPR